jgi:SH3 domain protein
MSKYTLILMIILGLCLAGAQSWAEKAYVTDSFKVTFRTGPSLENKIINMLPSGQALEILDYHGDWSHVRLLERGEDNKEGWVLSRFLISRQPWQRRSSELTEENIQLKEKLSSIENKLNESVGREQDSSTTLQETAKALKDLEKEYESLKQGAADYLKLRSTHSATRSKLETIQRDFKALNGEYERLRASQRNQWFISGASVLLCGLIIGLVLGRKQRKKRSSYY